MRCPFCNHENTSVKDSRPFNNGTSIKRRRVCESCNGKFTTFELVQLKKIKVIKNSGQFQDFDRDKLLESIMIATRKRAIPQEKIEELTNSIICKLQTIHDVKISTKLIGETIMKELAQVDKVAFIRFASVYMNFDNEKDLVKLIKNTKL